MAEFHFLRPLWLALIPFGLVLAWFLLRARARGGNWMRLVDPVLQRYVLAAPEVLRERRWPLVALVAATVLAGIALAGPTWERLPVPVFRSEEALVVALDLSRSMDATDVAPSRLARAKLKLLTLLERRSGGEMALVVFSAHAFTVTPLTTDNRTIAALVGSLFTSIMPSQGSLPAAGLEKAAQLLRQAGVPGGEILLISDATIGQDAFTAVEGLRAEGIRVSVLAVGTEEGAPIPDAAGGFVTDRAGQVVVPTLDVASLRRLAQTGGGRFAQLAPDERDLAALFPSRQAIAGAQLADDASDYEADVWRDQGVWLAVLLLPLAAFAFRRGWIAAVLLAVGLSGLPTQPTYAFEWIDLWKRPDRRGVEALERNDAATAAQLFEDAAWRGVAQYRAEEYSASADTLASDTTTLGLYNRGNALARAGRLEEAIGAYTDVLERDPEHEDAKYNRDLLEELLEQNSDGESNDEQNAGSGSGEQSADAADSAEQPDGSDAQQSQASSDSSNASPSDDEASESANDESDERGNQPDDQALADNNEQEGQPPPDSQALPEDIEQWASDQAADQWLRRVPQDPGGLLRRKFLYQYQRLGVDQDGNYVWPGDEFEPW
jgi:Ca-activated chloride channel family protein